MNEQDVARLIIQRLTNSRSIQLPGMTMDDIIAVIDNRRIPETLARCARYPFGTGMQTKDSVDALREWCLETLDLLHEANQWGEIDDDTYERLTTPQNYTDDYQAALREHAGCFEPRSFGFDSDGRHLYTLLTAQGEIVITSKDEQWVLYKPDFSN